MGINDTFNSEENPFSGILQNTVGLAPIGLGAAIGLSRLQANNALAGSDFGIKNTLGQIGEGIGSELAKADTISRRRRMEASQRLAERLIDSDKFKELLSEIQDQNTVIQSVLSTLDDPASGLDEKQVLGYKERLLNAAQKVTDAGDTEELLTALVNEIFTNNQGARSVFEGRLREFRKLPNQLVAANFSTSPGSPFQQVTSTLGATAQRRYDRLAKALGSGKGAFIDVVQAQEHTGALGQYARVFTGGKNEPRFVTMLPLDIDTRRTADPNVQTPYNIVRTGQAGTAYRADRYMLNASTADKMIKRGEALTIQGLHRAGAAVDIEDYYLNKFEQDMKAVGGNVFGLQKNQFNAFVRETLAVENRIASMPGPLAKHLRALGQFQSNTARLVGLERVAQSRRMDFLRAFGGSKEFDLGVGPDRLAEQNIGGRRTFVVGLRERSGIEAMSLGGLETLTTAKGKTPFAINRFLEPITGRAEQVVNRISQAAMFLPTGPGQGTGIQAQLGAGLGNILWSEAVTGATNKAVLIDVGVHGSRGTSGRIFQGLAGSGQAYRMGSDMVRSGFTIPIADPTAHGSLSSTLLNRIMAQKPGEMLELTMDELQKSRGFIGIGPSGPRYLPRDPRLQGMRVGFKNVSTAAGKQTIHLVGEMDRRLETNKLFGRLFKGTTAEVKRKEMMDMLGDYGVTEAELNRYNVSGQRMIVSSGDMLKKAPASFIRQMMTGFGMVTGSQTWQGDIRAQAEAILRNENLGMELIRTPGNKQINALGLSTVATMRALEKAGVNATAAGRVLAGVYNRGLDDKGSWLKGQHKGLRMNQQKFKDAVFSIFGPEKGQQVLITAQQGLAIGADTFSLGEGVGDWKLARGSVEPRLIENLQERLRSLGMANADISDFVASLYKRKIGYGDHMKVAGGMTKMAESIKGMRNITELLPGSKQPTKLTLENLVETFNLGGETNLATLLRKHEHGVIIDLKMHSDVRKQAAMRAAAENVFGGQAEIFLPGGGTLEAMRGTFIKTMAGEPSVAVGSHYERLVGNFGRNLQRIVGRNPVNQEGLEKMFGQFAKDSVTLATTAFQQLGSGRIRGSSFMVAGQYDVMEGTGLTAAQRGLVQTTMEKTKGTAVFVDHHGFFSMLKDYIGSGNQYNEKGNKVVDVVSEASKKLEMFFTGMEGSIGQRKGLVSVAARHPILSRGNVALTQMFRHVGELGVADDPVFAAVQQTEWGKKALANFKGNVRSFGDVAASSNKSARNNLFHHMARNLSDFTAAEGGGRIFMANQKLDVHFGSHSEAIDFGLASQAIGDFDGDQWSLFLTDKRAGQKIMSTLKSSQEMDNYLKADTLYKIKSHMYAEEAKSGLKVLAKQTGILPLAEMAAQDAMKEKASKEATGMLDVRLNELRRAVQSMPGGDVEQISGALALLKVAEEHTTIKGKKLPVYRPFAASLSEAVDAMMRTGDVNPFRRVLKEEVFPQTAVAGEGLTISGFEGQTPEWISKGVVGQTLRLDDEIDYIAKAANSARSQFSRFGTGGSPKEMARAILQPGAGGMMAMRDILFSSASVQGGIASATRPIAEAAYAAAGSVSDQILRATSKINRAALGPIVGGFGASMLAFGMMGDAGYSPEPLAATGEVMSPRIKDAMAAGAVFSHQGGQGPSVQDMQQKVDRYAMMDRPINTNTTYMSRQNSYQIGVQASSEGGYRSAAQFMSQLPGMGSSSSVTINDTRRPVTKSQLDRMTGEY